MPVGSVAEFFCQVRGEHEQLRVNRVLLFPLPRPQPEGIIYRKIIIDMDPNEGNTINITVTIEATIGRNNTVISCVGVHQGSSKASSANLTIQGRMP